MLYGKPSLQLVLGMDRKKLGQVPPDLLGGFSWKFDFRPLFGCSL